ncbi:MAG: L-seryl-tRNA(Sec) selenium transferase [Deltaproteobacteria bacterium]|nr:L-seryl-tRNA(Sec) selenium transferase [Deltaproteobacteria bacterium]
MDSTQHRLRQLPKIDALVAAAESQEGIPRWALTRAARELVAGARKTILAGGEADVGAAGVVTRARELMAPSLRRVINATGVILHTNLGRAPIAEPVLDAVRTATRYSNLELDVEAGKRGSRHDHIAALLGEVCGAEDACVVNNNAGAVMLALAGIAAGREVVVSRGELVEIGGSFRVPDVMALSGAKLVEVGTTNKTRAVDYSAAVTDDTALFLKVHQSNFVIVGFTEEASASDLAEAGRETGVATMMDLGSGSLMDEAELSALGLHGEPTVRGTLAAGIDLITFSCDKLLGGPQAGVIAGRRDLVQAARKHPLMRALRPDKLTIAALGATLELYRSGSEDRLPAVAMLRANAESVRARAEALRQRIGAQWASAIELVECASTVGAGAKPTSKLPSWALAISAGSADQIAAALRGHRIPIMARIADDQVLLDCRCLFDDDQDEVVAAVEAALELCRD